MEKEKKSKIKKILVNLTIFILLIILTFSLVLKDQDVSQIFSVAAKVKKQYILFAVLAMSIYILGEAVNITRILKELGEKSKLISNIRYKKEIEIVTFQGKEITLENLSPVFTPEQEAAKRRELEQQLYEVFRKYADKRQKEEAGA